MASQDYLYYCTTKLWKIQISAPSYTHTRTATGRDLWLQSSN